MDEDDEVICLCRQPSRGFMLLCDSCGVWFHGTCVRQKKQVVARKNEKGLEWICPLCCPSHLGGFWRKKDVNSSGTALPACAATSPWKVLQEVPETSTTEPPVCVKKSSKKSRLSLKYKTTETEIPRATEEVLQQKNCHVRTLFIDESDHSHDNPKKRKRGNHQDFHQQYESDSDLSEDFMKKKHHAPKKPKATEANVASKGPDLNHTPLKKQSCGSFAHLEQGGNGALPVDHSHDNPKKRKRGNHQDFHQQYESDSDLSEDFMKKKHHAPKKPKATETNAESSQGNQDWNVSGIDSTSHEYLMTLLPVEYEHMITAVQPHSLGDHSLTAVIRLPISSKEEALEWLTLFQASSSCDYRVYKTFPNVTKAKVLFKKQFRCHLNTLPDTSKGHHKKHVGCSAKIMVTVKNPDMSKSTDKLLKSHPLEVRLRHWHNHPINSEDVLRFRRPTHATKEMFLELFKKGHTPSSALRCHKFEMQTKEGDDFFLQHADGAVCPDLHWCYHLYYKVFKEVYGDSYGQGMMSKLEEVIEQYNIQNASKCADLYHESDDIVIALCTPLMKRVHEHLKSSGELVQLDFSGGMDRFGTRVGFLVTPSLAGGLPLGIIMCSSETEALITKGLQMLKELYPGEKAFFGRANLGPNIFMTDDAKNERNSLSFIYPYATLLLCLFHTLQAFLRYITASDHGVKKEDRSILYDDFKKLVRSKTEEEFNDKYEEHTSSDLWTNNAKALDHLTKDLHPRKKEWALCHREGLLLRGNNTTNFVESNIRQVKDFIFERLKAFNLVQLFDFFATKLDLYYQSRIAAILNSRVQLHKTSKHKTPKAEKLIHLSCKKVSENVYEVYNSQSKKHYTVDMEIEMCSGPIGSSGAPCKHQFFVAKEFKLTSAQFHATCGLAEKMVYHRIMVGSSNNVSKEWYMSLHDGPYSGMQTNGQDDTNATANTLTDHGPSHHTDQGIDSLTENPSNTISSENTKKGEDVEMWQGRLSKMFQDLSTKLVNRPDVFLPGVKALVTSYEMISEKKCENALGTALFKMKTLLKTGKVIRVQPTALSRRRSTHLGGRSCKQTGRPSKASRAKEHAYGAYTKNKKRPSGALYPTPSVNLRPIAPHSLSHRVDALRK